MGRDTKRDMEKEELEVEVAIVEVEADKNESDKTETVKEDFVEEQAIVLTKQHRYSHTTGTALLRSRLLC